jgi:hypothetical protein
VSAFIVQDAVHADAMSRHDSQEEAVATVQEWVRRGSAQPGELNVREIDATGRTIRVFGVGAQPLGSR